MRARVYRTKEEAQAACLRYIARTIDTIDFTIDEVEDGYLLMIKEEEDLYYEKAAIVLKKAADIYKEDANKAVEYIINSLR